MVKKTLLFLLLAGCNNFKTLAEACEDDLPTLDYITDSGDRGAALRINCYRRLTNLSRLNIEELPQKALEQHMSYLEQNTPDLNVFNQFPNQPSFVGSTNRDRLKAAQYTMPYSSMLTEDVMIFYGANDDIPADLAVDALFTNPFFRPIFLIPNQVSMAIAHSDYTIDYPEDSNLTDERRQNFFYDAIHTIPETPYAEAAVVYPRNGQEDVPAQYTEFIDNMPIPAGETHGFPITFSVGVKEGGVTLDSASLIGPNGPLEIQTFAGADASRSLGFDNTAIVVPEVPLLVGQTYQVNVVLTTPQGSQNARTEFTVGSNTLGL